MLKTIFIQVFFNKTSISKHFNSPSVSLLKSNEKFKNLINLKSSNVKIKSRVPNKLLYLQIQLHHFKMFCEKHLNGVSITTLEKNKKFSKENRHNVCELCLSGGFF